MLKEQIRIHENFGSQHLEHPRNVMVYLPPGYGADAERRYPVLYMHDGQNLYDPADSIGGVVWGVDETAQRLILTGEITPLIIVGIHNTGGARVDEYTPVKAERGRMRGHGGKADNYGRMIIEELKPFIDREYLTRSRKGIYRTRWFVAGRACLVAPRNKATPCLQPSGYHVSGGLVGEQPDNS